MKARIALVVLTLSCASAAGAVSYDANLGFGGSTARSSRGDVDAKFNGRFGLGVDVGLGGPWILSTGTDYVLRRVTWHRDDGARIAVDFDFIDVPVIARVRVCPIASVFAGLRFGINVLDKVEIARGTPAFDPDARAIITLGEAGLRFDLPAHFSLDAFYEREVGAGFAAALSDLSTVGGRLRYAF